MPTSLLEMTAREYEREQFRQMQNHRLMQVVARKRLRHKDDPYVRHRILMMERKVFPAIRRRLWLNLGRGLVRIGQRLIALSGSTLPKDAGCRRPRTETGVGCDRIFHPASMSAVNR